MTQQASYDRLSSPDLIDQMSADVRFQLAVEAGELGSWTHDVQTGKLICSAMFRQHFCLPPAGTVTLQDILDRVVPQSRDDFQHAHERALTQPGRHRLEVRILDDAQRSKVVRTHFQVLRHASGQVRVSGVSVDLTNRLMLEASADRAHALVGQLVLERIQRLAELNAHAVATIERERKTLARELHDEMGSILTLMSLELARLQGKPDAAHAEFGTGLGQLSNLVESLRQYKHRVISGLRPPLLQELGLEMAMQSYVDEFVRSANLEVDADIEPELPLLKEDAALALFRVLQEALTNTAKYAQARKVRIRFHTDVEQLWLEVTDDGKGLPTSSDTSRSFGLQGMRERIEALGGSASFSRVSHAGGTRILVSIPKEGNLEDMLPSGFDQA
ncbi:MAG: histidine kinase [Aquabacterium sp.]